MDTYNMHYTSKQQALHIYFSHSEVVTHPAIHGGEPYINRSAVKCNCKTLVCVLALYVCCMSALNVCIYIVTMYVHEVSAILYT